MKPIGNGVVTMVDDKQQERGFSCMKLIKFLWNDKKYEEWEAWSGAHIAAANGNCPFRHLCEIYKKTVKQHTAVQLNLF